MQIDVGGGARLFVDISGFGLLPGADSMVDRPVIVWLHGGPGLDHSSAKTGRLVDLAEVAQLVLYDHRGQGRSDRRPLEELTLDRWADDVVALCDVLGIDRPIVMGHSFGGFVAQRYLARHPGHPEKVVLLHTMPRRDIAVEAAAWRRFGGSDAEAAFRAFYADPNEGTRERFVRICGPLYTSTGRNPFLENRNLYVRTPEVQRHWANGELDSFDERGGLALASCPVLVMAAVHDPVCPVEMSDEIVAALPSHLVTYRRFEKARHSVLNDEPELALATIREFIGAGE